MDSQFLQKLLTSTIKSNQPTAKLSNILEPTKLEILSRRPAALQCKSEVIVGNCDLCGINGSVKNVYLEHKYVNHFRNLGFSKPVNDLWFCCLCEQSIQKTKELGEDLHCVMDEMDGIVAAVKTVLRLKQSWSVPESSHSFADIKKLPGGHEEQLQEESSNAKKDIKKGVELLIQQQATSSKGSQDRVELCEELDEMRVIKSEILEVGDVIVVKTEIPEYKGDLNSDQDTEKRGMNCKPNGGVKGAYTCALCVRSFRDIYQQRRHLATHTKSNAVHKCCFCLKQLPSAYNLRDHYATHKDKKNPGKCKICGKVLVSFGSLKKHHVYVHGTHEQKSAIQLKMNLVNSYHQRKCQMCSKTLASLRYLKEHYIRIHGSEEEKKSFALEQQRKQNERKERQDPLTCYFCKKFFHYKSKYRNHLYIHTKEAPIKCSLCEQRVYTTQNLSLHYIKKHGTKEENEALRIKRRNYKTNHKECYFCGKIFKTFCTLEHHITFVHTKEVFRKECGKCHKVFLSERNLQNHKDTVCSPVIEARGKYLMWKSWQNDKRVCYFCTKAVVGRVSFEMHLRSHTLENPYKCTKCSKSFNRVKAFQYHTVMVCKTDTSEKKRADIIRRHSVCKERKRNRIKKACDNCGRIVKAMKSHMKLCTMDPASRRTCKDCGALFDTLQAMMIHSKTEHEKGTVFDCYFCFKRFSNKYLLARHFRSCHTMEKL